MLQFARTCSSSFALVSPIGKWLLKLGLNRCALLFSLQSVWQLTASAYGQDFKAKGIDVSVSTALDTSAMRSGPNSPKLGTASAVHALTEIIKYGVRVIVTCMDLEEIVYMAAEARLLRMMQPGWAWIDGAGALTGAGPCRHFRVLLHFTHIG